ncbi:hypothetical protein DK37_26385 [Halomonas sp. SUBG004]|nr:hypothetical protein DK37_26385 [Halomonas sp. SUBG004]
MASITQVSDAGSLSVEVTYGNTATQEQVGDWNEATANQAGYGNVSEQFQQGDSNVSTVMQYGAR